MALPKIEHPIFTFEIPTTKKKIKMRPLLVKEEKVLLMAKEGGEAAEILASIKQVVNNCVVDDNFDIDKIALVDLEYLFIKLRGASVSNVAKVVYLEGTEEFKIDIDLDKVTVVFEDVSKNIKISNSMSIVMRYPEASLYSDKEFIENAIEGDLVKDMACRCIDKIIDGDEVYLTKDVSMDEIITFVDSLRTTTHEEMQKFIENSPHVYYTTTVTLKDGTEKKIELKALSDFFTL